MALSRQRGKGRREGGSFVPLPHFVLQSPEWAALDAWTVKLLLDLLANYKGHNNGDLALTWAQAKERGWHSPGTLARAKQSAIDSGFVIQSRQGGRNLCSLYAVTFYAIDECKGKLDIAPTRTAPATWRKQNR